MAEGTGMVKQTMTAVLKLRDVDDIIAFTTAMNQLKFEARRKAEEDALVAVGVRAGLQACAS